MCGEKINNDSVCLSIHLEKLTQPALLLIIGQKNTHGYELIQKLNQLDFIEGELEAATVYRTLRRMEQEGLIVSRWEHGEFGPARRQYSLTRAGWEALEKWSGILNLRLSQIKSFLESYYSLTKG